MIVAGSKAQRIHRIVKWEETEGVLQERVRTLLDAKSSTDDGEQPTLNAYYRDTFNVVDNFNKVLSETRWPHDVHSVHVFYFVSCLRMLTTNIIALYLELQGVTTKPDVRTHVEEMAELLMK
jgi:hypothetical protein